MLSITIAALTLTNPASAAEPRPDRPMVTRTGQLAEEHTLEMELGAAFSSGRSRTVPMAFKYSIGGAVEPRIMTNFAGYESGAPRLEGALKIRLFEAEGNALSMWISSRIPIGDERWSGQWHALFTTALAPVVDLRINGGLDFIDDAEGSITFGGTPLTAALIIEPVPRLQFFAELAGKAGAPGCDGISCAYGALQANGGVLVGLTPSLTLDASVGYAAASDSPQGTLGITSNFGRLGAAGSRD